MPGVLLEAHLQAVVLERHRGEAHRCQWSGCDTQLAEVVEAALVEAHEEVVGRHAHLSGRQRHAGHHALPHGGGEAYLLAEFLAVRLLRLSLWVVHPPRPRPHDPFPVPAVAYHGPQLTLEASHESFNLMCHIFVVFSVLKIRQGAACCFTHNIQYLISAIITLFIHYLLFIKIKFNKVYINNIVGDE